MSDPQQQQLSLFSNTEEFSLSPIQELEKRKIQYQNQMSATQLQQWKLRVLKFQGKVRNNPAPQQTSLLFDLSTQATAEDINPFALKLHPFEFYRSLDTGDKVCFYFVIDSTLPLLLYVGETEQTAKQRWQQHDCQQYVSRYVELNRQYGFDVKVGTAFSQDAPYDRHQRQKLETELIYRWRSPFNKQNWKFWGQPFGKLSQSV